MRDALSILDMCLGYGQDVTEELVRNVLGTSDRAFLFRFAEALQLEDASVLMGMIDELMRGGREPIVFAKDVSQHLRALLMAKCCPDDLAGLLDLTAEDAAEYAGQAEGFTQTRLMRMLELFMSVETDPALGVVPAAGAGKRRAQGVPAHRRDRHRRAERPHRRAGKAAGRPAGADRQRRAGSRRSASGEARAPANAPKKQETPRQAVLTPTGRSADETWKEALSALKRSDGGIFSMLSMGRFAGSDGTTYRWESPMGMDFYATALNKEDKRKTIADALTQAAGVESRFEAATPDAAREPESDRSEASLLGALAETFHQENVMVQEEAK